jgi:hypothetical protein
MAGEFNFGLYLYEAKIKFCRVFKKKGSPYETLIRQT